MRGPRAQRLERLDRQRALVRLAVEHGVEGVGRVDAREILRVGVPRREVAPAGALLRHDRRAQRRRVFHRAGGADHLPHEHRVQALLVVGEGPGDLVGYVHHQQILRGSGCGRGARRGACRDGVAGEERLLRLLPGDAVHRQAVVRLERAHGALRDFVVAAGDLRLVVAELGEPGLQRGDEVVLVAILQLALVGERRGRGRRRQLRHRRGRGVGRRAVAMDGGVGKEPVPCCLIELARLLHAVVFLEAAHGALRALEEVAGALAEVVAQRGQPLLRGEHGVAGGAVLQQRERRARGRGRGGGPGRERLLDGAVRPGRELGVLLDGGAVLVFKEHLFRPRPGGQQQEQGEQQGQYAPGHENLRMGDEMRI